MKRFCHNVFKDIVRFAVGVSRGSQSLLRERSEVVQVGGHVISGPEVLPGSLSFTFPV